MRYSMLLVAGAMLSFGCMGGKSEKCSWGGVCPSGLVCHDPTQDCWLSIQIAACQDVAEGDFCTYPGVTVETHCTLGVCKASFCGDGLLDFGETCDDGNTTDCDGCRGDCSAVETGCGDGFVCGGEICDDGNNSDCSGGCSADCSAFVTGCGDGFLCNLEDCDRTDLGGETCQTQGFAGGTLTCNINCTFNTSGCRN